MCHWRGRDLLPNLIFTPIARTIATLTTIRMKGYINRTEPYSSKLGNKNPFKFKLKQYIAFNMQLIC